MPILMVLTAIVLINLSCPMVPLTAAGGKSNAIDTHTLREHGDGRWIAFSTPVPVRHCLQTPALTDYELELTVDVLVENGKQKEVRLAIRQIGKFSPAIRPSLPSTSHLELTMDNAHALVLPPTTFASADIGGKMMILDQQVTIPLRIFAKMRDAKSIKGRLYWRSQNDVVEYHDIRTFQLDSKFIQSLKALDEKTR